MNAKLLIDHIATGHDISTDIVSDFIGVLSDESIAAEDIATITTAWKNKGQTPAELYTISKYIKENYLGMMTAPHPYTIDCCGTGGDNAHTYNISTTSAFILGYIGQAHGLCVAKHGGRKTTSSSGSIDFLEALGVNVSSDASLITQRLQDYGLAFIASPATQKLLGRWKGICRTLGYGGMTGLIGTLTNPVHLSHQIIGVPYIEWGDLMIEALKMSNVPSAMVVHGMPSLDEASIIDKTHVWSYKNHGDIQKSIILASDIVDSIYTMDDIRGGTPTQNVSMFWDIMNGHGMPALTDIISLNTGLALYLTDICPDIMSGMQYAKNAIINEKPLEFLQKNIQKSLCEYINSYIKSHNPLNI